MPLLLCFININCIFATFAVERVAVVVLNKMTEYKTIYNQN